MFNHTKNCLKTIATLPVKRNHHFWSFHHWFRARRSPECDKQTSNSSPSPFTPTANLPTKDRKLPGASQFHTQIHKTPAALGSPLRRPSNFGGQATTRSPLEGSLDSTRISPSSCVGRTIELAILVTLWICQCCKAFQQHLRLWSTGRPGQN